MKNVEFCRLFNLNTCILGSIPILGTLSIEKSWKLGKTYIINIFILYVLFLSYY